MADDFTPPMVLASDTVDGETGFFSRLSDAATKGIPTAAISGALSIYNTALDYTGREALDTEKVVREYGQQWGDYYQQNKEAIDFGGFVGTSFIPGGLGVKALKLARAGNTAGSLSTALNLAPNRSALALERALLEMGKAGGSVTSAVTSAKRAQLAWGVADNVLTSAAAELAILATMNDSPIFDNATAGDLAINVVTGAALGGAIGGVLEHWGTRGILKQAQNKIELSRREFDIVSSAEELGLKTSDEILNFAENIIKLPDDYYATNFNYKFAGQEKSLVLDTAEAFRGIRAKAEKLAFDKLAIKFNELADGGEVTGQALNKFIFNRIKSAKDSGKSAEYIQEEVQGYLHGVKTVKNLEADSGMATAPKQFFLNQTPKGIDDLFVEMRGANTGKQAYYLKTSDPSQIKWGSVVAEDAENSRELFRQGYDAVITKKGTVSINPKSAVISRTPDAALNRKMFLDLEEGGLTQSPVVTGADLLKKADDFKIQRDVKPTHINIGKNRFDQAASEAADLTRTPLASSARFMWAKGQADSAFKERVVKWNDFPLIDRMAELPQNVVNSGKLKIELADGRLIGTEDIQSLAQYSNELKLQFLQETLESKAKGYDLRELSTHLNVDKAWLESAISSNFVKSRDLLSYRRGFDPYFEPRTVEVEWSDAPQAVQFAGPLGPNHQATVLLGHHYELLTRKNVADNAFQAVFGKDADRFMDSPAELSRQVSERGAGSGTYTSANADYGRVAELWVQDTGKQHSLLSQKLKDEYVMSIAPQIAAIRESTASAAELGALTTALRRDPRKYKLVRGTVDELGELGEPDRLVDSEVLKVMETEGMEHIDDAVNYVKMNSNDPKAIRGHYEIDQPAVADFMESFGRINLDLTSKKTPLLNAAGITRNFDPTHIHVPPVDTTRYPHFAFVVSKPILGQSSEVTMMTAKDANQLRQLANSVPEEYEVVYKADTKRFFEAKGKYDYNLSINESRVNSDLQRKGILGDFFPETRAQNVLEDYVRWISTQTDQLVRTGIEVKNRQFFSDLNFLSEQFQQASSSTVRGFLGLKREAADPFLDYRKTALNISKQSEYPLLDSFNEFVDKVGTKMYSQLDRAREQFTSSKGKDLASLQQANDVMDRYGLGKPYEHLEQYLTANEKFPKNALKVAFQKANTFLATSVLRLDFANSLVQLVSTPILLGTEMASIRRLAATDPELAGKLSELTTLRVPGQVDTIPSTTRLLGQAIKNFFGADKDALIQRYTDNGDIIGVAAQYHRVLDDLAYHPGLNPSKFSAKIDAAVEKGATITGNNLSEQLSRFISADVMRQLTDPLIAAGKMNVKEQNAYISSFVNRVQGNYVYSQRPALFQGTTGAAIGLFQTYAFNVLQQLFRHVENRDARSLMTFGALQTSLYGFNGLPFFDAINMHIVGSAKGNVVHEDAYSFLPKVDKDIGDWMLYGTASAFPLFGDKSPALYSRGDINPRHLSIVPINPLDIPAVSASIKLVDSIRGFGKNVSQGADISTSMLQALEHHGLNRPLAGFAQVLAGQATTNKGSLISAANDLETTSLLARIPERLVSFGGAARIFGAKPMDEAVALSAYYRSKQYQATDRLKIEALGQAVKTKLGNNQMPTPDEMEDFMKEYTASGGRIETFSSSLQRWMRDSNSSIINQMAQRNNSSYSRKLQELMGGEVLPDYNSPSIDLGSE